jgi:hypothetical protein
MYIYTILIFVYIYIDIYTYVHILHSSLVNPGVSLSNLRGSQWSCTSSIADPGHGVVQLRSALAMKHPVNGGFNGKTIGKPIGKWMLTLW